MESRIPREPEASWSTAVRSPDGPFLDDEASGFVPHPVNGYVAKIG
jgi:hypothetical protein